MILSIQSHVAYGYVGNRAAVFPLQRMGYDVAAIHTVQFSNHTGYGAWTGEVFSPTHIENIIDGLRARDVFPQIKAILSGYLGDPAIGHLILELVDEIRMINPHLVYCCDPVMGDMPPRGFFVREFIPPFFRDEAIKKADILTPNQFELNYLSGITVTSLGDAISACRKILNQGSKYILVTSLTTATTADNEIQMLLVSLDDAYLISTPRYPISVNGSGDVTAALFLGHFLRTKDSKESLELTATGVHTIFKNTFDSQSREIRLIESQDSFVVSTPQFRAEKII
jgi:pyridoxine kinase